MQLRKCFLALDDNVFRLRCGDDTVRAGTACSPGAGATQEPEGQFAFSPFCSRAPAQVTRRTTRQRPFSAADVPSSGHSSPACHISRLTNNEQHIQVMGEHRTHPAAGPRPPERTHAGPACRCDSGTGRCPPSAPKQPTGSSRRQGTRTGGPGFRSGPRTTKYASVTA